MEQHFGKKQPSKNISHFIIQMKSHLNSNPFKVNQRVLRNQLNFNQKHLEWEIAVAPKIEQ